MIQQFVGAFIWRDLRIILLEQRQRWVTYWRGRNLADSRGMPLLNVGCPRLWVLSQFRYPCGDVCLDTDPRIFSVCRSKRPTLGDVREMPFPDATFGATLCFHVLEHLPTVVDAQRALGELRRVTAGEVLVLSPARTSIWAWIHPDHKLWVDQQPDGSLTFVQRR